MSRSPLAMMLAGMLALGAAQVSLAQPPTGDPAKQTPEQAKKQAEEAAKKDATVKAAATAQPGAPAGATPGPNAIPVPSGTPIETKKLDSGLVIEDLKIGEGYEVKAGDWLSVNYHGMLKDGTVFQSSFYTGEPVLLSLNQVIEGWKQGLPGIKLGGVRRLTIPSALAYRPRRPGQHPSRCRPHLHHPRRRCPPDHRHQSRRRRTRRPAPDRLRHRFLDEGLVGQGSRVRDQGTSLHLDPKRARGRVRWA